MKKSLLSILFLTLIISQSNAQCTVTLNSATVRVTQDSTIATNLGAIQFYLVCEGVTLTYNGTQSADVTYYLEDAAKVISGVSHEAILYMKRLSSIDANYSQSGQWAITNDVWHDPSATLEDNINGSNINQCPEVIFNYGSVQNCNATTSINENNQEAFINIYPNPANDILTIDTRNEGNKTIFITNVLGKEVKRISENNAIISLNVTTFNPGTYFVHITNNEGAKTIRKVVINR
jgi:hypothetical protein